MIDIDALDTLEKLATPAPWVLDWDYVRCSPDDYEAFCYTPTVIGDTLAEVDKKASNDRLFVEALRNSAPDMIKEIRSLREQNVQMREALELFATHDNLWIIAEISRRALAACAEPSDNANELHTGNGAIGGGG